jgi:DNA polymerase-3 subunit alpha
MLESAIKLEHIAELAKTNNMPAVAMTDRNNLFGSLEFALNAAKSGVQPISGMIATLYHDNLYGELILLAKNQQGIQNLFKIGSLIYTKNSRMPREHVNFNDLIEHQDGLIVLSGWIFGHICKYIAEEKLKDAEKFASKLKEVFGDRFYFEISRHNLMSEKEIEAIYLELAETLDIPLVATNNILFENFEMHDAHDTLLCIANSAKKDEENRPRSSNECYFKSSEEMWNLFKDIPSAYENTYHIARRCSDMMRSRDPILPNFVQDGSEEELFRKLSYDGLVRRLEEKRHCEESQKMGQSGGLRGISPEIASSSRPALGAPRNDAAYFDRLQYELDIICKMQFPGYFLIVSDFIRFAKENKIPVGPGRGSGAGSIVAWALLITDLDPLRFGLLFERFLNPERVSMPDFDIDFCQERRMEVIEYVINKYGANRVAQIITFGKLQAKAVVKDVARALGLRYFIADRVSKLVPFNAVNPVTLARAIEEVDELKQASLGEGLYNAELDSEEKALVKEVIKTALKLEGLHRHASIHAAGIVIAGQDLVELLPLYKEEDSNMLVIQYSMKYAEQAGLVKFDFLGLKTLTTISKCCELLEKEDIHIDISKIPFDDSRTYAMLSTGASSGVFQFDSPGMKDSIRKLKPDAVEDLIALGALYRPGPMDNIPTYIACKHGQQAPDYLHPLLVEVLTETYGVIIYQEQVMQIAQILAGYSLGAADLLRRAMGKKVKAEMDAQAQSFSDGAKANNIDPKQAKEIFDLVAKFAGYGFNKSHAAAYGVISYQTAYLKANYLVEFLVATLNLEIHDTDKINLFIQEAKVNDIVVIMPNINKSDTFFGVCHSEEAQLSRHCEETLGSTRQSGDLGEIHEIASSPSASRNDDIRAISLGGKQISFALGAIKNMSVETTKEIILLRTQYGAFKNIFDFAERVMKLINKRVLENLIKAGAFDELHSNRRALLESVDIIIAHAAEHQRKKTSQQMSLFDLIEEMKYPQLVDVADFNQEEKAFAEYEGIGFFLDEHPLSGYEEIIASKGILTSDYVKNNLQMGNHHVRMVGIISAKDARMSARGKFVNLHLSDHKGIFEATIFNEDIFKEAGELLDIKSSIVLDVEVRKDAEGGTRITVQYVEDFADFLGSLDITAEIPFKNDENLLKSLKESQNRKGANKKMTLIVGLDYCFEAKIELPGKF